MKLFLVVSAQLVGAITGGIVIMLNSHPSEWTNPALVFFAGAAFGAVLLGRWALAVKDAKAGTGDGA